MTAIHVRRYQGAAPRRDWHGRILAEPFWDKVDKSGDCWVWIPAQDSGRYGNVKRNGRPIGAHRLAYEEAYGPLAPGQVVLHRCDNPPCVRPEHLRAGTPGDNVRDCAAKGRIARGLANGRGRISDEQVRDIRRRRAAREPLKVLAVEFGIPVTYLCSIATGRARKDVAP